MQKATERTVIFAPSSEGKSMLSRLTEEELKKWTEWANQNAGVNGIEWQGWADVRAREALNCEGDPTRYIAGSVYNDALSLAEK